eukprot:CAMPEP_0114522734 /NCGR_PEP_ID=MMETSP0109-20121206/20903_1 /TAXON_ID=29199 /ORGANISM="Chlorarachnion reptans, Strain CCCM449" /LENGTH=550 /DNA_ID=CAMNT_0001703977 /DNA_START=177 /DNA_END=1829 /DNA_ORIENTATION=-
MMKHLLENKEGMKIAVIVNDMAELNIDAELIKAVQNSGGDLEKMENREMVELQNGCICCNLREDLLKEVYKMTKRGQFDNLVIESSGICEPKPIAETFAMNLDERPSQPHQESDRLRILNSAARLDTMVSVVDTPRFWDNLQSLEDVKSKYKQYKPNEEEGKKHISDLLVEQVEFANVIILNKLDLMKDRKQVDAVKKLVKRLNPGAKIYETEFSKIEPSKILNTGLFDIEELISGVGWLKEMKGEVDKEEEEKKEVHSHGHGHGHGNDHGEKCDKKDCEHSHDGEKCEKKDCGHGHSHSHGHDHGDHNHGDHYGITSFVYKRRRPFHPERLFKLLDKSIEGVMRSKGYSWIASRHNRMAEWNNAGKLFRIEGGGPWFDANIRFKMALKHHPDLLQQPQVKDILKDFVKPYGDRRQEIVIIGAGITETEVTKLLDKCLLTDDEMKLKPAAWKKLEDPLPKWPKAPFELEEEDDESADESHLENLRFKVGDKVECCIAPQKWAPGTIVKLKYRQSNWPKSKPSAPYQIELDDGMKIFAPFDDDRVIRLPQN